jgi:hypothetical protein
MAKKKDKLWNVFYTTLPCEHELLIEAPTLEAAVDKVRAVLTDTVQSVKGGWELKE